MDKDILRLVIIAAGILVITGMVLWSLLKNKKRRRDLSFYDQGSPLEKIDESLILHPENDDFDVVPLGSVLNDDYGLDPITTAVADFEEESITPEQRVPDDDILPIDVPVLIQFSLVARADEGFNGVRLYNAFARVGLEYGTMKVFERVDQNRMVDFAVASMVEPGTFPEQDLENFYCPGLVFFMQPRKVDDALSVFDDFIQTIDLLAIELDGVKWDHQRQPLTEETVERFRLLLQQI